MTELAINGGKEPAMEGRTKGPHEFLSVFLARDGVALS